MKTNLLLFLCTANHCRGRFAEILFNRRAHEADVDWWAISRGLAVGQCPEKRGAIASPALLALSSRGIDPGGARQPIQLTHTDLAAAHHVIALSRDEHAPLLRGLHAGLESSVQYWDVADRASNGNDAPFAAIERQVDELLARLGNFALDAPPLTGVG